ncbi:hypothetical protein BDN72DRAFT_877885 [Pluteus cervinus]|uniref:Uncharacterized protein n=1 Tax=Pluteus cervinus TaxID=181527 RepID=A0ACD3AX33_9AGAR|nr:hypothetical protein BDN72DRAFT_877885 [Pluteus cervinus]
MAPPSKLGIKERKVVYTVTRLPPILARMRYKGDHTRIQDLSLKDRASASTVEETKARFVEPLRHRPIQLPEGPYVHTTRDVYCNLFHSQPLPRRADNLWQFTNSTQDSYYFRFSPIYLHAHPQNKQVSHHRKQVINAWHPICHDYPGTPFTLPLRYVHVPSPHGTLKGHLGAENKPSEALLG